MEEPKPARRKRGAQPGNRNALKHGFYSRLFREGELTDLTTVESGALEDEVVMLRVSIRRMFEMTDEAADLKEWGITLNTLGLAASRLARLLKVQQDLSGSEGDSSAELAEALRQAVEEVVGS